MSDSAFVFFDQKTVNLKLATFGLFYVGKFLVQLVVLVSFTNIVK